MLPQTFQCLPASHLVVSNFLLLQNQVVPTFTTFVHIHNFFMFVKNILIALHGLYCSTMLYQRLRKDVKNVEIKTCNLT